jgi:hypothetical protein
MVFTVAVCAATIVVFFLPVSGLASLGLAALAAWCCTIPVWIVQSYRQRQPVKPSVIVHEDGSIEVLP